MSFGHPWVLLLLILPVAMTWWEWTRRGHRLSLPFDHASARSGRWLGGIVRSANLLTPSTGDPNTRIPETKAFMVNVTKL